MILRALGATVLAILSGCAATAPLRAPIPVDPLLPRAGAPASDLLTEVARLERSGAPHTAQRRAHRYAIELLDCLAVAPPGSLADAVVGARLAALDLVPVDAAGSWLWYVQDRAADPARHQRFDAARAALRSSLELGDVVAAAAACPLPTGQAPEGVMTGAARAWEAHVASVNQQPAVAVARFAEAARVLTACSPLEGARVRLLEDAALRSQHGDRRDPAVWLAAVQLGALVLATHPDVCDPLLWTRAAETKPPHAAWPAEVIAALLGASGIAGAAVATPEQGELACWYAIGEQHRRRSEPLAALVAFRKAETHAASALLRSIAQVGQAKALAALGRGGDARSVLLVAAEDSDAAARAVAMAMLGALELAENRYAAALRLLEVALAEAAPWPGRGEAMANRGIAILATGEESEGLQWLARARAEFTRMRDFDGLEQCLENEVTYREGWKGGEAREARAALEELARRAPETPAGTTPPKLRSDPGY